MQRERLRQRPRGLGALVVLWLAPAAMLAGAVTALVAQPTSGPGGADAVDPGRRRDGVAAATAAPVTAAPGNGSWAMDLPEPLLMDSVVRVTVDELNVRRRPGLGARIPWAPRIAIRP